MFGQFSLAANSVVALHLATSVFLVGNHISDEQESRRKAKEHETRGDKI